MVRPPPLLLGPHASPCKAACKSAMQQASFAEMVRRSEAISPDWTNQSRDRHRANPDLTGPKVPDREQTEAITGRYTDMLLQRVPNRESRQIEKARRARRKWSDHRAGNWRDHPGFCVLANPEL